MSACFPNHYTNIWCLSQGGALAITVHQLIADDEPSELAIPFISVAFLVPAGACYAYSYFLNFEESFDC